MATMPMKLRPCSTASRWWRSVPTGNSLWAIHSTRRPSLAMFSAISLISVFSDSGMSKTGSMNSVAPLV